VERPRVDEIRRLIAANLLVLHRHGVRLAIGSDRYRETARSEASALHRLGTFDNRTLLKMWCETTPQAIFPGRKIARFRDGYEASFLVLEGDPLADFENVGRIRMRVKQGQVLPEP
jgi:imidazolonepropionase-like amidohydrolase